MPVAQQTSQPTQQPSQQPQEKQWCLNDFQVGKMLGQGKFGSVYLAREKQSGFVVALKCLYKQQLVDNRIQHQLMRYAIIGSSN